MWDKDLMATINNAIKLFKEVYSEEVQNLFATTDYVLPQSLQNFQAISRAYRDMSIYGSSIVQVSKDTIENIPLNNDYELKFTYEYNPGYSAIVKLEIPEENCPFYCTKCGIGTPKHENKSKRKG